MASVVESGAHPPNPPATDKLAQLRACLSCGSDSTQRACRAMKSATTQAASSAGLVPVPPPADWQPICPRTNSTCQHLRDGGDLTLGRVAATVYWQAGFTEFDRYVNVGLERFASSRSPRTNAPSVEGDVDGTSG